MIIPSALWVEALTISLFAEIGARSSVDRVLASEAKGRRFDSCRARQNYGLVTPKTQKTTIIWANLESECVRIK